MTIREERIYQGAVAIAAALIKDNAMPWPGVAAYAVEGATAIHDRVFGPPDADRLDVTTCGDAGTRFAFVEKIPPGAKSDDPLITDFTVVPSTGKIVEVMIARDGKTQRFVPADLEAPPRLDECPACRQKLLGQRDGSAQCINGKCKFYGKKLLFNGDEWTRDVGDGIQRLSEGVNDGKS